MSTAYVFAVVIGVVAGSRAMTAPAAVSWAAALGVLHLSDTWLAFLGFHWTPWILSAFAVGELITDQLPSTPSRTVPVQFGTRIVTGALSGAAVGTLAGSWPVGAVLGATGAVIGTLAGRAARGKLAAAFGRDLPAALLEDLFAVGVAALTVLALR